MSDSISCLRFHPQTIKKDTWTDKILAMSSWDGRIVVFLIRSHFGQQPNVWKVYKVAEIIDLEGAPIMSISWMQEEGYKLLISHSNSFIYQLDLNEAFNATSEKGEETTTTSDSVNFAKSEEGKSNDSLEKDYSKNIKIVGKHDNNESVIGAYHVKIQQPVFSFNPLNPGDKLSSNKSLIVSAGYDKTLKFWLTEPKEGTYQQIGKYIASSPIQYLSVEKNIAAIVLEGYTIQIWDV